MGKEKTSGNFFDNFISLINIYYLEDDFFNDSRLVKIGLFARCHIRYIKNQQACAYFWERISK